MHNNRLPSTPDVDVLLSAIRSASSVPESEDINVLALVKGGEYYVFLYSDPQRQATLRTLGRFAAEPTLTFTWYDAAVLVTKIRQGESND